MNKHLLELMKLGFIVSFKPDTENTFRLRAIRQETNYSTSLQAEVFQSYTALKEDTYFNAFCEKFYEEVINSLPKYSKQKGP